MWIIPTFNCQKCPVIYRKGVSEVREGKGMEGK